MSLMEVPIRTLLGRRAVAKDVGEAVHRWMIERQPLHARVVLDGQAHGGGLRGGVFCRVFGRVFGVVFGRRFMSAQLPRRCRPVKQWARCDNAFAPVSCR